MNKAEFDELVEKAHGVYKTNKSALIDRTSQKAAHVRGILMILSDPLPKTEGKLMDETASLLVEHIKGIETT
jgi:hypothetical protein